MIKIESPNFNDRPQGAVIDSLIIHATGMQNTDEILERLCDPKAEVSAHYVIDLDGTVYNLVDPHKRAWHAGVSNYNGRFGFNDFSIGIELVNFGFFTVDGGLKKHDFTNGYNDFPKVQIATLIDLIEELHHAFPIRPEWVLAHSDISPTRRADPGPKFPWGELRERGLAL